MGKQKAILAFVVIFGLAMSASAAGPDVFTGYGKTRWGQTIEEVQAIYPQMKEVSRYRELKKVPLDSPATEDASGYPVNRFYSSPAPEPLQEMVFGFADGRLYIVEIAFSERTREKLDDFALARIVWEKYFATEKSRKQLEDRSFVIQVISRKGGNYITDRPTKSELLLQPNMYQYGSFDLGISYQDKAVNSLAFDVADKRRKQVEDQRLKQADKAAEELGVRDLL